MDQCVSCCFCSESLNGSIQGDTNARYRVISGVDTSSRKYARYRTHPFLKHVVSEWLLSDLIPLWSPYRKQWCFGGEIARGITQKVEHELAAAASDGYRVCVHCRSRMTETGPMRSKAEKSCKTRLFLSRSRKQVHGTCRHTVAATLIVALKTLFPVTI